MKIYTRRGFIGLGIAATAAIIVPERKIFVPRQSVWLTIPVHTDPEWERAVMAEFWQLVCEQKPLSIFNYEASYTAEDGWQHSEQTVRYMWPQNEG